MAQRSILVVIAVVWLSRYAHAQQNPTDPAVPVASCDVYTQLDTDTGCRSAYDGDANTQFVAKLKIADEYIEFTFAGPYKLTALDLLQSPFYEEQIDKIRLVFDDGSSQVLDLPNGYEDLNRLQLIPAVTTKIRIYGEVLPPSSTNFGFSETTIYGTPYVEEKVVTKQDACFAVMVDISGSIDDEASKIEQFESTVALVDDIISEDRYARYNIRVSLIPFSDKVFPEKVITSDKYQDKVAFRTAVIDAYNEMRKEAESYAEDQGLTDLLAALHEMNIVKCAGGVNAMVIISDYIWTVHADDVDVELNAMHKDGMMVIPIGLSKERVEELFDRASRISGFRVDMREADWEDVLLKVITTVLP